MLITVRDQRGEWVDCMRWLHHRNFVGLWRETQKGLQTISKFDDIMHELQLHFFHAQYGSIPSHDVGTGRADSAGGLLCSTEPPYRCG